jgi:hypothetical protein
MKFRPPPQQSQSRRDILGWRTGAGGVGTTAQQQQRRQQQQRGTTNHPPRRGARRIISRFVGYCSILLVLYALFYRGHHNSRLEQEDYNFSSFLWSSSSSSSRATDADADDPATGDDDSSSSYYFPRWPTGEGVSVRALAGAMRACLLGYSGTVLPSCSKVYLVDDQARLWGSDLLYENGATTNGRLAVTEPFLQATLRRALQPPHHGGAAAAGAGGGGTYPHLHRALRAGGFGFMVNYNDTVQCFNDTSLFLERLPTPRTKVVESSSSATFRGLAELQQAKAIPLFTMSAPLVDCDHAYPMVNYQMISDSVDSSFQSLLGRHIMTDFIYPLLYRYDIRHSQKPMAVWRGTATGSKNQSTNVRHQLCAISHQYPHLVDAKSATRPRRRHPGAIRQRLPSTATGSDRGISSATGPFSTWMATPGHPALRDCSATHRWCSKLTHNTATPCTEQPNRGYTIFPSILPT